MSEPTPGRWFCENDGIYNSSRSYLVTPTGDSEQDRADAAHIAELHNVWTAHQMFPKMSNAAKTVSRWMERALAAESQVAALSAQVEAKRGGHEVWVGGEWVDAEIYYTDELKALRAQVEAYRGLEMAARATCRELGVPGTASPVANAWVLLAALDRLAGLSEEKGTGQ